ncbi:putative 3,4-dihydroxy-2-butanone kinase, partial [Tetrabaena socialis]
MYGDIIGFYVRALRLDATADATVDATAVAERLAHLQQQVQQQVHQNSSSGSAAIIGTTGSPQPPQEPQPAAASAGLSSYALLMQHPLSARSSPSSTDQHRLKHHEMSGACRGSAGKKLLNSPETAVIDAIEGLVLSHAHLQRLEGAPQIKVVINRRHDRSKVALVSGGGSGHEPAHAGYVGDGMLAAAVCGDVFASPSTEAVLAAIRAVTGPAGCLLIVKNYTGDRLNFGLAAEQALSEGLAVEVVVVGEDVAIEAPSPLAGRRGLAGTVLVHK